MSVLLRLLDDNDEDEDNWPGFGCTSPAFSRTMYNHVTNTDKISINNSFTENFRFSNILPLTNNLFSMFCGIHILSALFIEF